MKKGFKIENIALSTFSKNNILVFNYEDLNKVKHVPCIDDSVFLKQKFSDSVGVWKIKYKSFDFQLN